MRVITSHFVREPESLNMFSKPTFPLRIIPWTGDKSRTRGGSTHTTWVKQTEDRIRHLRGVYDLSSAYGINPLSVSFGKINAEAKIPNQKRNAKER